MFLKLLSYEANKYDTEFILAHLTLVVIFRY